MALSGVAGASGARHSARKSAAFFDRLCAEYALGLMDEASACGGGAGAKFAVIHALWDGRRRGFSAEKNAVFRMVADG